MQELRFSQFLRSTIAPWCCRVTEGEKLDGRVCCARVCLSVVLSRPRRRVGAGGGVRCVCDGVCVAGRVAGLVLCWVVGPVFGCERFRKKEEGKKKRGNKRGTINGHRRGGCRRGGNEARLSLVLCPGPGGSRRSPRVHWIGRRPSTGGCGSNHSQGIPSTNQRAICET
jgi:hypothetical protein